MTSSSTRSSPRSPDHPFAGRDPDSVATALRERIYATLTGVATLTLLLVYAGEESVWSAVVSVVLAMGTLWLASLVSEVIAHGLVRQHPDYTHEPDTGRRIWETAGQSLLTLISPVIVILLSLTGIWSLRTSLIIAMIVLMSTLAIAALLAVRGSTFGFWTRVLIVAVELALGGVVILGKVLAH